MSFSSPAIRWSCLALMSLAIAGIRLFSYNEPPEWDIGTYLVAAHEMNHGEKLYLDAWDSKPPAIFATFALAERVVGYGQQQIYLLSVAAGVVTLLAVYAAGSVQSRTAGLWAALLWLCVCFEPLIGANLPNTEVFINAALAWAFVLLLREPARWSCVAGAGLLLGIASLFKQISIAPATLLLAAYVMWPIPGTRRATAARHAAFACSIAILLWAGVLIYFAPTSRGWLSVQTCFVHASHYSGNVMGNLAAAFRLENLLPACMQFLAPLALAGVVPIFFLPQRRRALLAAWMVGTFFAVAWPGKFHPHYFQLWLPVLVIAAGCGIDRMRAGGRRTLAPIAGAALACALLAPQFSWFRLDGEQWAQRKYAGFFTRARSDADEIARLLQPGETFYAWSDEAWIYYRLRRRPPAVALWKTHTLEGPLADWLSRRTVEQLERDPPRICIDWVNIPSPADHPIRQFLDTNYTPLDDGVTRWPFVVHIRRDGVASRG